MKKWYLMALWFDNKVLKFATGRFVDAAEALQGIPYGWKDFMDDDGPATVTVHEIDVLSTLKDLCINVCTISEGSS